MNSSQVVSVITSSKNIEDSCITKGLFATTMISFPLIDKDRLSEGFVVQVNQKQSLLDDWNCGNGKCKIDSVQFETNQQEIKHLLLYQKIMTSNVRDMHVSYSLLSYDDNYFVYNEVMFLIWIGIELIFILLVLGLKDNDKVNDKNILIPSHGSFRRILITVILNNSMFFPFQVAMDSFWLRKANTVC